MFRLHEAPHKLFHRPFRFAELLSKLLVDAPGNPYPDSQAFVFQVFTRLVWFLALGSPTRLLRTVRAT